MDIVSRIRKHVQNGTVIPKPCTLNKNCGKGWGMRRGQPALIYSIPNHKGGKPYEKGIAESELRRAYRRLRRYGRFTRKWFNRKMTLCANEGPCNFTTIGGLFEFLGKARYTKKKGYLKI